MAAPANPENSSPARNGSHVFFRRLRHNGTPRLFQFITISYKIIVEILKVLYLETLK
jgi:hypothetical protein